MDEVDEVDEWRRRLEDEDEIYHIMCVDDEW